MSNDSENANPYEAPAAEVAAQGNDPSPPIADRRAVGDLRLIARFQQAIQFVILAQFGLIAYQFFGDAPAFSPIVSLVVSLIGWICMLLLSLRLYSIPVAILFALAMLVTAPLIPLIAVIVLVVVNSKATRVLRQHDIRVGLVGARLADIQ